MDKRTCLLTHVLVTSSNEHIHHGPSNQYLKGIVCLSSLKICKNHNAKWETQMLTWCGNLEHSLGKRWHNLIKIHNNVLWDWKYFAKYSSHSPLNKRIFHRIMSIPQNIVMDMNNIMDPSGHRGQRRGVSALVVLSFHMNISINGWRDKILSDNWYGMSTLWFLRFFYLLPKGFLSILLPKRGWRYGAMQY